MKPTWCPGCGDYGILNAIRHALADLSIAPHEMLVVSGIGCGSKLPDYMHVNGITTIHGRPLAVATGAKLANHDLNVIVVDGDGDAYGIGGNHFIHTARRNLDLTHLVENNQIYALTKGQYSPTTPQGRVTVTSPDGVIERAVNPVALALTMGATFVARAFAGEPTHLADVIKQGIRHRGYALIDVLQPCVIFNRINTYQWYSERIYKLDEEGHDPQDRAGAERAAAEWDDRIPIGVIYRDEGVPTYEEQLPALLDGPLVGRSLTDRTVLNRLKQGFM
ncbi:2-oxoacid:ferredoxin oxidoreductase subunit beta [Rhodococcus ruber]|uniref:2-oxoacid:ferredoxin oxidoreductase subunit beta n=1 Tax=Rhodococcus TaxID=1827 RepID=UPI000EB772E7|nr:MULTISPECIES: 2-oxoacid:ferredoxin oxidoreductase subunit beta [Rhodococcus]AXY49809.1 2-oxoacid:acceptor oxidoreductase, beta subunit, pyruvate/2-ketoisovalerate family [Rhodococcus ruber]UQB73103.1 2-oxoacid:ferredoxin oxidoreductase subunit beta [Rhodococcus ruber]WML63004.1 2-oxoacid:ferredoxin oxidoreductase subunit beta [Rhodococcus sp. AH-ZY2]